jgi:hypothetical protein
MQMTNKNHKNIMNSPSKATLFLTLVEKTIFIGWGLSPGTSLPIRRCHIVLVDSSVTLFPKGKFTHMLLEMLRVTFNAPG